MDIKQLLMHPSFVTSLLLQSGHMKHLSPTLVQGSPCSLPEGPLGTDRLLLTLLVSTSEGEQGLLGPAVS